MSNWRILAGAVLLAGILALDKAHSLAEYINAFVKIFVALAVPIFSAPLLFEFEWYVNLMIVCAWVVVIGNVVEKKLKGGD